MATSVIDQSAAVKLMLPDWQLAKALLGGTRTMREAGETYLPAWPKEASEAYTQRLASAVLFPAYQRTVQTLSAKPFSKPITFGEDIPTRFEPWLDDIDLQGRNIDAFAADVLESALGYGIAGILVEYPKTKGLRTMAQEQRAGLRPYWVEIKAEQILGWRAERADGVWKLLQLRLLEAVEEPDGDFGTKFVPQVRVLSPGEWATYRRTDAGAWSMYETGMTTLREVPFVPVYGGRTGFMMAKPPLIEVAHLNVAHWQCASDQQTILHVARVPILTVTGVTDDKWTMTVGSSVATSLPDGAKMQYVEHSGAAIAAGAVELDKIEERMRQAGAELLVLAPGRYTATQIQTENSVGLSVLQRITQSYEDALDQALAITARWVGEANGGHVTLFNDYGVATLQEASAQLLLSTNQAGKLSDETLHSELQRRGILSADVDWTEEQLRIEQQGPSIDTLSASTDMAVQPNITEVTPIAPRAAESFDMTALVDALSRAFSAIDFPAPIVNIAAAPAPNITVDSPNITVNVPEQPASVVNVSPPNVRVVVEKGGEVKFTEDEEGNITGAVMQ